MAFLCLIIATTPKMKINLNEIELQRYHRNILLPELGEEGQLKLKSAKVLVVGAGGLGSSVCMHLVAAGVGRVGIMDHDVVEISNLQRQLLYSHPDLGESKALKACEKLADQNPFVEVVAYDFKMTDENASKLISEYDLIIGALDNSATRYLIDSVCQQMGKPYIHGAVSQFDGQLGVFNYKGSPSYRALFPDPPINDFERIQDKGILSPVAGTVGSLQALEALKIILHVGDVLAGRLLIVDFLKMRFTTMQF